MSLCLAVASVTGLQIQKASNFEIFLLLRDDCVVFSNYYYYIFLDHRNRPNSFSFHLINVYLLKSVNCSKKLLLIFVDRV